MGRHKRRVQERNSPEDAGQVSISMNSNSNCKAATISRKWNASKTAIQGHSKIRKSKRSARSDNEKDEESSQTTSNAEVIQFNEDQDRIDFGIDNAKEDFPSDGEINSEEEGDNPDDHETSFNQSMNSEQEQSGHNSNSESQECDENVGTDSDQSGNRRRPCSVVTKVREKSVEEKLDHLTSALFTMQDMMIKKGFFEDGATNSQPSDQPSSKK